MVKVERIVCDFLSVHIHLDNLFRMIKMSTHYNTVAK